VNNYIEKKILYDKIITIIAIAKVFVNDRKIISRVSEIEHHK